MADRVNTKFVVLLISVLVVLSLAVAGAMMVITSADRLVAQGDDFAARGQHTAAAEKYGRALGKLSNDETLLLKYLAELEKAQLKDPRVASQFLSSWLGSLRDLTTRNPSDTARYERLMAAYQKVAAELRQTSIWDQALDRSQVVITNAPDPNAAELASAYRYRGIAQVNRMLRGDLSTDEKAQAQRDLIKSLEMQPNDPDACYYLAVWYVHQAQQLEQRNQNPAQAKEFRRQADHWSSISLAAGPDDPRRIIDRLDILANLKDTDPAETPRLTAAAVNALTENPNPPTLIEKLATILLRQHATQRRQALRSQAEAAPDDDRALKAAQQVLSAARKADPANPALMFYLADVLERLDLHDQALALYKQAYDLDAEFPMIQCLIANQIQTNSGIKYASLKITSTASMPKDERESVLAEAETLLKQIQADVPDAPAVNVEMGRIAAARGQWKEAAEILDRANEQYDGSNPLVLLQLGQAWDRAGQTGVAAERLERLLELQPAAAEVRTGLVKTYIRLGALEKAQRHLNLLLNAKPDDPDLHLLNSLLLAAGGDLDRAIETCLALKPRQNRQAALQLANLYLTNRQPDQAAKILEQRLTDDPTDLIALRQLVALQLGPERTQKFIAAARNAGADSKTLERLERLAQGDDPQQLIEEAIEQVADPLQKNLRKYEVYRGLGKNDQAAESLKQAAAINPNHPSVIEAQFRQALTDSDWATAESIANRAASADADGAAGKFYFGRLAEAQGELQRAANQYRAALQSRPIYSEGWQMQGAVQLKMGQLNEALDSLTKALDQQPRNTRAIQLLAMTQDRLGRNQEALDTLRRAVRSPHTRSLWNQYLDVEQKYGDPAKVLDFRRKMAQEDPDNPENRFALAQALAQQNKLDEAKAITEALVLQPPLTRKTVELAAAVRLATQDPTGGRKLIQDYVHNLGDQAEPQDWTLLGRYLLSINQEPESLAAFRQALAAQKPGDHSASHELAQVYFAQRHYDLAAQTYHQILDEDPNDRNAHLRYIDCLLAAQNPKDARQWLQKLVDSEGQSAQAYMLRARIDESQGLTDQAIQALTEASKLAPRQATIFFQRGRVQAADAARQPEAIADLKTAIELDAQLNAARRLLAQVYDRLNQTQNAVTQLRAAIDTHPDDKLARLQLAQLYTQTNQLSPLAALLDESVKFFPDEVGWLQLQAQLAFQQSNPDQAVQKLQRVLDMQPSPTNLRYLAIAQIQASKPRDALATLDRNKSLVENQPVLMALRSRAQALLNRPDTARSEFEAAARAARNLVELIQVRTEAQPGLPEKELDDILQRIADEPAGVLAELALAQLEAIRKDNHAAAKRLDALGPRLAQDAPIRLDYDRLRAAVLYQVGRRQEAESVYKKMLEQWPDDLMLLNNYGYLLSEEPGRQKEGLVLAKRAAELAPTNALVLDTYGWSLLQNGQTDRAVEVLQRSTQIQLSATNALHLAQALSASGKDAPALEMLNAARDLAQKNQDTDLLKNIEDLSNKITPALNGATP